MGITAVTGFVDDADTCLAVFCCCCCFCVCVLYFLCVVDGALFLCCLFLVLLMLLELLPDAELLTLPLYVLGQQ